MLNSLMTRNQNQLSPLSEFRREMDRLFDDFWTLPTFRTLQSIERDWSPSCDVVEEDNHYLFTVEMPGVPKEDIKLEVVDNQLLISGERRSENENKKKGEWYSERQFGKFQRAFSFPSGIDANKIEAQFENGVLRIYVPKPEMVKPRQIQIGTDSKTGFFGKMFGKTPKKEQEAMHSSSGQNTEEVA